MSKTAASKKTRRRTRQAATTTSQSAVPEGSVIAEYAKAILFAVILALFIRTFVVQAFRIPSGSMENTLLVGDFLLVNKFIYGARIPFTNSHLPGWRDPQIEDIIVFQYPEDLDRDFIKRIVAGPGQIVEIKNKVLYVNDQRAVDPPWSKYVDPHILKRNTPGAVRDNFGPETVPQNHYFVMGDSRDNSEDSRYWGFLHQDLIRGKAFILYWSWAPDLDAPRYTGLTAIPRIVLYNLLHLPQRTRWGRIGMWVE